MKVLTRAAGAADNRPVATIFGVSVVAYAGLAGWALLADEPLLIARASADDRGSLYSQFASTSVALLAVCLTVLAILVALPDRDSVAALRQGAAWPKLQAFLLSAGLLCLITLVGSHLGAALDDGTQGNEWLGMLVLVAACMSVLSVLAGGVAFALFLHAADEPSDPGEGRGMGS